jgi:hypothetical protein
VVVVAAESVFAEEPDELQARIAAEPNSKKRIAFFIVAIIVMR